MKKIHTFHNLSQNTNCQHLITQKDQTFPYSFSLALHTQENPFHILENRKQLKKHFIDVKFIVANQTHSDCIYIVSTYEQLGWDSLKNAIPDCDALITNQNNIILTILTADCVPILLFDPVKKVVAAVHAGWKGTEKQILFKTVKKMQKNFNCNPKDILAGIAPSIGKCCYEVNWDVAQHFKDIENAYIQNENKYLLNLPFLNKFQLLKIGLLEKNIEMSNICTSCEVEKYFSYRKEAGCSGRFMSIIGLSSK